MARLFVTATGTGVGKTRASTMLLRSFARLGWRVGACKPVETGVGSIPQDAAALLEEAQRHNPAFAGLTPRELCAYTFSLPAAPFCADREKTLDPARILTTVEALERRCDLLVIEGAGGLMVPLLADYFMIDLARDLQAEILLVTPSRLGCINETLLSLEALRQRKLPRHWCVNLHEDAEDFNRVTRPFYDAAFGREWWTLQEGIESFCRDFSLRHAAAPAPRPS